MSRNEWEGGKIKIPTKAYAKLRTTVCKANNDQQDEFLALAETAYTALKKLSYRKRKFDYELAFHDLAAVQYLSTDDKYSVFWLILKHNKLTRPKKKDLKKVPASKGGMVFDGEWSIHFDNKTKVMSWDVMENNHACDRAHESKIVQVLFRELGRIEWTGRSGGLIVGNDEYNRDDCHAGGGGNYVVRSYGKQAKAQNIW